MSSPKQQSGFTLVELLLVLAIAAVVATITAQTKVLEAQQAAGEALAGNLVELVKAARRYRADNESDTSLGTQAGVDWLKSNTCGGQIAGPGYLPCNFASELHFDTTATTDAGTADQLSIRIDPVTIGGAVRTDISGAIAQAITASLREVGAGTTNVVNHNLNNPGGSDFGAVVVDINTTGGGDWIATDNSNPPVTDISWDGWDLVDVDEIEAREVRASEDVEAARDVVAGRQVGTPRLADTDDTSYVLDPDGNTVLNNVRIRGNLTVDPGGQVAADDAYYRDVRERASRATYTQDVVDQFATVPYPTCPRGARGAINVTPAAVAAQGGTGRQWSAVQTYARRASSGWRVYLRLRTARSYEFPRAPWAKIAVTTKCE